MLRRHRSCHRLVSCWRMLRRHRSCHWLVSWWRILRRHRSCPRLVSWWRMLRRHRSSPLLLSWRSLLLLNSSHLLLLPSSMHLRSLPSTWERSLLLHHCTTRQLRHGTSLCNLSIRVSRNFRLSTFRGTGLHATLLQRWAFPFGGGLATRPQVRVALALGGGRGKGGGGKGGRPISSTSIFGRIGCSGAIASAPYKSQDLKKQQS